ncbi:YegS/Rv2252/BmrU family lipid kinase [Melghirimyces profundicolus]|uniref:YegS/Rv2252/BmrU family lipid kinase n=1 Tax=Melghirimyces profundicolus TaxID=1242148 RepID=A0A2T6C7H7_9BACL|nr:diacylglycerol kinase family protein [Melghirimyces profundicolus]PTX64267.1 YegS/Rv2252/BmrU family lipid kinase [Melghirimyces profundicolus]
MHVFIVNPMSGNGRGEEVWFRIQRLLSRHRIPHQVHFTKHAGHATELARSATGQSGVRALVALGGDGTVHETGNALVGTGLPLGYIPAGTGNDFAHACGIPSSPGSALRRVLKHEVHRIDTASIGERFLIGFAGIGFDGQVAEVVNRSALSRKLGRLAYLSGFFQALRQYRPARVSLTLDGSRFEHDRVWLIAVGNIPNYGGGMKICPGALPDDGRLDICCVSELSRGQVLKIFPAVFKGNHVHHPSVKIRRGLAVEVDADPPLVVHADGEIIGKTPLSILVRPGSLNVIR